MVDEILREVTAQVTDVDPPTAVSLACCAKLFEEPALSALWRIQNELPTLIQTLPPDTWEVQPANTAKGEEQIVRDSSKLRDTTLFFENSQLRHDCDTLVLGVGAHSVPIERRVGQVQKIRVLDEEIRSSRMGGNLRRCVPRALLCDLGWSGVSPTSTHDLDVCVGMGADAAVPLTIPGVCGLFWRRDETWRSGTHYGDLSPSDDTFRRAYPQHTPTPYSDPLRALRSRSTTGPPLQATHNRVFTIGNSVGAPHLSSEVGVIEGFWHPVYRHFEIDTPRNRLPRTQACDDKCGQCASPLVVPLLSPQIEPATRSHRRSTPYHSRRRHSKSGYDRHDWGPTAAKR